MMRTNTIAPGLLISVAVVAGSAAVAPAATLGISSDGQYFTIDGVKTYLFGQSYYGSQYITTAKFLTRDLDDMVAQGYNWIRVWATWKNGDHADVSTITPDGKVQAVYMDRLKALLTEADKRRLIVEVVVIRNNTGDWIGPRNQDEHLSVIRTLTRELAVYRNVYFDVANERNLGKKNAVSVEELRGLIAAVKTIDAKRLCTASHGQPYKSAAQLNDDIAIAGMDLLTAHLGRTQGIAAQTYGEVRKYIGWMKKRVPFHLNEPFRRGFALRYNPVEEDFYRDNSGAKLAGAAGWCFHNGSNKYKPDMRPFRSFEMSDAESRLYDQFDRVESTAVRASIDQIGSTRINTRRYQVEYSEQIDHVAGHKDGLSWIAETGKDSAGLMTKGPGQNDVPAGRHSVTWQLQTDDVSSENVDVAVLEVVSGDQVLVSRSIQRRDFRAVKTWQDFRLDFVSHGQQHLEFRTDWRGRVNLQVNWIELDIGNRVPETSPSGES